MGWLARLEGEPVGYAVVADGYKLADLIRLGVLPAHQRKGIGRRLLALVQAHYTPVMLCCRTNNQAAHRLYVHAGFRIIGKTQSHNPSWIMVAP